MTQKEFLKEFLNSDTYPKDYLDSPRGLEDAIDLFLEQHHKEYFEVEHIRKDEDQVDHFTAQG